MIVTTTSTIEGYRIKKYVGVVSAHIVGGTNIFSDFAAGLRDIVGGRSKSYENQLQKLDDEAVYLLIQKARELKANAIIGLQVEYDSLSGKEMSMLMVNVIGTAVIIDSSESNTDSSNKDLLEFKSTAEKKRRFEEDANLIFDGATSIDQLIKLLDSKIEQDPEFYEFIIQYPRSSEREDFSNIIANHREQYFTRKKQEGERKLEAEKERRELEEQQKRSQVIEKLVTVPDDIKIAGNKLKEGEDLMRKAIEEEEKQSRKVLGKNFKDAISLFRDSKMLFEEVFTISTRVIKLCNQAQECNIEEAVEYRREIFDIGEKAQNMMRDAKYKLLDLK
ncbi:MAG: YbjQ family protein [Chlorobiales bacterium]|nr:YbjQ family protein [Chlorobiales bacterium]